MPPLWCPDDTVRPVPSGSCPASYAFPTAFQPTRSIMLAVMSASRLCSRPYVSTASLSCGPAQRPPQPATRHTHRPAAAAVPRCRCRIPPAAATSSCPTTLPPAAHLLLRHVLHELGQHALLRVVRLVVQDVHLGRSGVARRRATGLRCGLLAVGLRLLWLARLSAASGHERLVTSGWSRAAGHERLVTSGWSRAAAALRSPQPPRLTMSCTGHRGRQP